MPSRPQVLEVKSCLPSAVCASNWAQDLLGVMAAVAEVNVPSLYRQILKAAKRFPSIKRDRIVQDIKTEFHENKALSDPEKVTAARKVAVSSLQQLQDYVGASSSGAESSVSLRGACLGGP